MAQLSVPAGDTHLHAIDTPGGEPALVFLNGGFGTVHNWKVVTARLAGRYRTVRFDARARGKSGTSADYSVATAVDDIGRVIQATEAGRVILVGWSHGATIAVRFAAQHPEEVDGLVLVDGGFPVAGIDEAGKQRVRTQFRRVGWIMRILAVLGRSARMSPDECADVVIELDEVNGTLSTDFAALTGPTVFILGHGAHSGATAEEMRTLRDSVSTVTAANPLVSVFATTSSNHTQILRRAAGTIAEAIEAMATRSS